MKYKFTMTEGYKDVEFIFNIFAEGCTFMQEALNHSNGDISFTVEAITEEEEGESTVEE
jgi:hypothetical protein